jgi:hypothetical protein
VGHDFQTLVDSDDIKIKLQKNKENKTKNTQVGCIFCFCVKFIYVSSLVRFVHDH